MLLKSMVQPDPMRYLLEWLCKRMMEAEVESKLEAGKSERTENRQRYRSGISGAAGYPDGDDVPDGAEASAGRVYTVLCHGAEAVGSDADSGVQVVCGWGWTASGIFWPRNPCWKNQSRPTATVCGVEGTWSATSLAGDRGYAQVFEKRHLQILPGRAWQRCKVHFMRNILCATSRPEKGVLRGPAQANLAPAGQGERPHGGKRVAGGLGEALSQGSPNPWAGGLLAVLPIRSDSPQKSYSNQSDRAPEPCEIHRRTRVVGIFLNPASYVRLVPTIEGVRVMYKVIVVDDEQMERMALSYILKNSGLPVTIVGEAADGLEAVKLFFDVSPDIVLIDIKMPCKDGLEASFEMLKSGADAVTIFLTAYDEFEYAQKAVRLGALDYILKPARPEEVVKTVNTAIKELENRKRLKNQYGELKEQTNLFKPSVESSRVSNLINSNFGLEDLKKLAGFLEMDNFGQIVLVIGVDRQKDNDNDQDNHTNRTIEAKPA